MDASLYRFSPASHVHVLGNLVVQFESALYLVVVCHVDQVVLVYILATHRVIWLISIKIFLYELL